MTKTARSRRKLAFFAALFPYLGGKRRLCPLIFREIDRVIPRRRWPGLTLIDGFLGGGSVSLYAKAMGFRVISSDIADRAITVGRALIENSRTKLTRDDVLRLLTPNSEPALRIERDYVPQVFTQNVARFIDRALAHAAVAPDPAKAALLRMLAIRVALLEHPMSQVRKGTIHRITSGEYEAITESCVHHYVDGLRLTRPDRIWALAEQVNAGVFQGDATVIQESVFDVLPRTRADIAYFDPPYPGVMSYEKEYRVIDEILEGASRPTSPFTARDGAAVIDGLLERAAHIPIWLLSLGNEVVTIGELEEKMRRLGRETRAIAIQYQHLPSVATEEKKATNREFLVVGWDPAAELLRGSSVHRLTARDVPEVELAVVATDVHADVDARGPVASPAGTLAQDRFEESKTPFAQQTGANGRVEPVAELEHRIDPPDSVRDQVAVNRNREVPDRSLTRHEPEPPLGVAGSQEEHAR